MIEVGVCQKNACDRTVAQGIKAGLQLWCVFDLPTKIRRCVDQEPTRVVAADHDAGLRLRSNFPRPRGEAIHAGTVPLRQATAGCAAKNMDANQPELRGD